MSVLAPGLDGWSLGAQADRRYRHTVAWVGIPALVAALLLPQLQLPRMHGGSDDFMPPRQVMLLPAPQAPVPVPVPVEATAPPPVATAPPQLPADAPPRPQPGPTEAQMQAQARERAQRSGLLAMKDRLTQLQEQRTASSDLTRPLLGDAPGSAVNTASSTDLARAAAADSGGIGRVAYAEAPRGQPANEMGLHRTAAVERPQNLAPNPARQAAGQGRSTPAGRTLEEIQLAFDRNKGAFHAIFNRAMRDNPNLGAGKIVVSLTIAPSGAVIDCTLVSSTFNDPDLERKVIQRVMLLDFGGKAVPEFIYPDYPINFLPS